MDISVGKVVIIQALLKRGKAPFAFQQIQFSMYRATDKSKKDPLHRSTVYTDVEGLAVVAYDTDDMVATDYIVECKVIDPIINIFVDVPFSLVEDGAVLKLVADSTSISAGDIITLTCTVNTGAGNPKPEITVQFIDLESSEVKTARTNAAGQAVVKWETPIDLEKSLIFKSSFGGTDSNSVTVAVTPETKLELRANNTKFRLGEKGTFTVTLTKGGKAYPQQQVDIDVR